MKEVPDWTTRPFECAIDGYPAFAGTVTHAFRDGWNEASEQYVVAVTIRHRTFKFTLMRDGARWSTQVFAIYNSEGRVCGLHTFVLSNTRIEFLFEEALLKLAHFQEDEPE
jgi:hypothetical protein